MPDKAKKEASYRPSAFYWRKDIRAARAKTTLAAFIRDLGDEVATHCATLQALGKPAAEEARGAAALKGTRADLQTLALRLVTTLERLKAEIRAAGEIPPKSRLSPSEAKAKPHLLGR